METEENLLKLSKSRSGSRARIAVEVPEKDLVGDLENPVFRIEVLYDPKKRKLNIITSEAELSFTIGFKDNEKFILSDAKLSCGVVSDYDRLNVTLVGKDENDNFIDVKMNELEPGDIRRIYEEKFASTRGKTKEKEIREKYGKEPYSFV